MQDNPSDFSGQPRKVSNLVAATLSKADIIGFIGQRPDPFHNEHPDFRHMIPYPVRPDVVLRQL